MNGYNQPRFGSMQPETDVPSFLPQMASIPEMLGKFAERRMQLMRVEQAQQAEDRRMAHQEQTDAYYKTRLEQGDRKQQSQERFQNATLTQKEIDRANKAFQEGKDPGIGVVPGLDGEPFYVEYKFKPGRKKQAPAIAPPTSPAEQVQPEAAPPLPAEPEPQAQPVPTMMGKPLSIPQLRAPGMGGGPLPPTPAPQPQAPGPVTGARPEIAQASGNGQGTPTDPELDALMSRATQPQEPQASDNTIFLDENDEGTTRALLPPGDTGRAELPMRAYPEGAKVGDRFAAEDVNLKGGYGNPFAGPVAPAQVRRPPEGGTVFFDENNDGDVRALSGPDDGTSQTLPINAFPPGAKEGDRFNAEDVNLRGGKGNPFAGPTKPIEMPQPQRVGGGNATNNLLGASEPASTSRFVPGRQIQGASAAMPQGQDEDEDGVWEATFPGSRVVTFNPRQARQARDEEARAEAMQIKRALVTMGDTPEEQVAKNRLLTRQVLVVSGMSLRAQADMQRSIDAATRQVKQIDSTEKLAGNKIASTEGMHAATLASRDKLAAEANATRRATSKYGRGGGSGKTPAQSSGQGSAFAALKPVEQSRIENAANNGVKMLDSQMNWTKLEGAGFDRLNLALRNIQAKGDLGGAQQMEAMMNFFGYIRGGVPAKNETDEFKSITRTLGTTLDSLGQKVGIKDLWTNFTGSDKDKAAIAKIAQLPEGQRAGLEQAIVESQKAIQGMALKNISAQIEGYKSAGKPFHERIQDKINAKLRFIGEKPRQWFSDSPLIPDFDPQAGGSSAPTGQPAPTEQAGGKKPSLRELLGD
jgi:hypothetical protein